MAAGGSTRIVVLALIANLGIALAKLFAAIVTRSGAMLAEAIHSFADSGNQGLLLLGMARASRPPNERHPLGYGRESYFWALLAGVVLFALGGLYSLYEGIHKLTSPQELRDPWWAIGVLLLGCLLEGYSLRAAWREADSRRKGRPLLRWARSTGDVNLLVVVFEDLAAMAGLIIALIAVALSMLTGSPFYDALGSCVLGVLLLAVAVFIVSQVRRLIVGFAAGPEIRDGMAQIWDRRGFDVVHLSVLWCGPAQMLVVGEVRARDHTIDSATLVRRLDQGDAAVLEAYPDVAFHFVEPDVEPGML